MSAEFPIQSAEALMPAPQLERNARSVGYIPSLDGWRAIAILWVIQNHSPEWHFRSISNHWVKVTGDRGVQLFFALSGLLICTRLVREEKRFGVISLRSFYSRRLFRIQPAALFYLAVLCILMLARTLPLGWSGVIGAFAMIRNFYPKQGGTWQTVHFWSLAVEEHFYLFLPGFLLLCRRFRLTWMLSLTIAFELWRIAVFSHPCLQGLTSFIYFRTDMVIGTILLGSACALGLNQPTLLAMAENTLYPWLALVYSALVFAAVGWHDSRANHALMITVYPVLILATMLHPASLTTRVLEWAPLRFIGRISFSLYLWQQLFFNPYLDPRHPNDFHLSTAVSYAATFCCAIASYYLIETPLTRRGHKFAKRFEVRTRA